MSEQIKDASSGVDTNKEVELIKLRRDTRHLFWRIVKNRTYELLDEAPSIWKGPDERFYRTEKKIVSKHGEPIYWGALASFILFATFRLSGSRLYSRFRETYFKRASTTTAPTNSTSSTKKKPEPWKSYSDKQAEKVASSQKELTELPLDAFISLMGGASVTLLLTRTEVMKKDFIESPLNPGKSLVADIFCPAMESAYRNHVDPRVVTKESLDKDDTINMFLSFVKNCQTRSGYIAYQEGLGTVKRPDVIPYPGLEGVRR